MNDNEYLVGVYKEVGKDPKVIKIKNQKEHIEKLLDGEYKTLDCDNYIIIYKKDSDNLLANIYVNQYSQMGISLKGKIFAVGKDEKGILKSFTKEQAKKCILFFVQEAFNYKNFDEYGRYIPRDKRREKRKFFNSRNSKIEQKINSNETIANNEINIGNQFFENKEKIKDSSVQFNTTGSSSQPIQPTDEQTLNMILKIVLVILDFVKEALDDSDAE